MNLNLGSGKVLTTIVYPVMVGGQMTLSSHGGLRISWGKGHVSSIYRMYFLTKTSSMEFSTKVYVAWIVEPSSANASFSRVFKPMLTFLFFVMVQLHVSNTSHYDCWVKRILDKLPLREDKVEAH